MFMIDFILSDHNREMKGMGREIAIEKHRGMERNKAGFAGSSAL